MNYLVFVEVFLSKTFNIRYCSKYRIENSHNSIFYRYLKAAKEVQQRNEKLKDKECNALLQNALEMNTEVWLPEK